jgi:hypothetical protein
MLPRASMACGLHIPTRWQPPISVFNPVLAGSTGFSDMLSVSHHLTGCHKLSGLNHPLRRCCLVYNWLPQQRKHLLQ